MSDHDIDHWSRIESLLRRTLGDRTPVFVDGGTNRGDFTERLLQAFPTASVQAVEADPALAQALRERFAGRAVRVWNAALHHSEGTLELLVHENRGTSSIFERPADARRYFDSRDRVVERVPVPARTLDAIAREAGLGRIDLLKLDTQGAEVNILRGAQALLAAGAIDAIYTEFFVVPHYEGAPLLPEIWQALAAHGYTMLDFFKGPVAANGQLRFGDALFVSPRVRREVLDASPEEA